MTLILPLKRWYRNQNFLLILLKTPCCLGVTVEMMKLLFPADVEEITLRAAEQRNAALWSGKASTSDISVGLALGKAVATSTATKSIIVDFARKDGMGTAGGNAVLWKQLYDSVENGKLYKSGQQPWISLDNPKRPPMLPNFGKVWGWNMTAQISLTKGPLLRHQHPAPR